MSDELAGLEAARRILTDCVKSRQNSPPHAGRHILEGDPETVARALLTTSARLEGAREALTAIERRIETFYLLNGNVKAETVSAIDFIRSQVRAALSDQEET